MKDPDGVNQHRRMIACADFSGKPPQMFDDVDQWMQ